MNNLHAIGCVARTYADDHGGAYPTDLRAIAQGGANHPKLFIWKSSGHRPGDLANVEEWSDDVLVPVAAGTNRPAGAAADRILAFEKPENRHGQGGRILYADGSVVSTDGEEFSRLVAPFLRPGSGPSPGR